MKSNIPSIVLLLVLLLFNSEVFATPTQFGVSGLLSQPTADTLESGNISVGLWLNGSQTSDSQRPTILPFSLTLGLGKFIETYGSYANLMFNDDEAASGRGFANIGFKARVLGKRSSPYKLALDFQARRHLTDNAVTDGETALLARAIATFKAGRAGFHLNSGYLNNDESFGHDDQWLAGAALEYFPVARLRLIAELDFATPLSSGLDDEIEAMAGVQYFYSPHLTLHAGVGVGLTDESPDWRLLAGVTTSQGIGTYLKPVPQVVKPYLPAAKVEKPKKKSRFKTITPLLPMSRLAKPVPIVIGELPVNPGEEKIVVKPESQLQLSKDIVLNVPVVTPVSSPVPVPVSPTETFKVDKPIKTVVYRKFRLEDVNFAYNQHSLSDAGSRALAQVADSLRRENKWFLIRIDGHTDSVGSEFYNDKLSYQRAASVGQQLVANEGFDPARIFIIGFGESLPVASNKTDQGRMQNRRAEILVLLPEEGD